MKKLLAGLLCAALLTPGMASATYSCYGTRSPCDLTGGIRVTQLESKPAVEKKVKKVVKKKATAKKTGKVKKAAVKKKPPETRTYCYPEPRELPTAREPAKQSTIPAEQPAPVKLPEVNTPAVP